MNKKILLIVNLHSGKGTIKRKLPSIINNLSGAGYEVDVHYTKPNYKPAKIMREYNKNVDLIICCGGDGTLNEVVNYVMKSEINSKISFIPLGTMNDFAHTIKMSTNKTYLSRNINNCRHVKSDIGKFNTVYFNYVAAFGAFVPVPYVTPQSLKRIFGKFAYFIVAFSYISKIREVPIVLEVNGKHIEDEFVFGSISNSKTIGRIRWFKRNEVKIDDGKFEMMFVKKPKNVLQFIDMVFALLIKNHNKKYFYFFQTDEVSIKSDAGIPWTLDGEYGGRLKHVTIKNNKQSVTYIVPV